MSTLPVCFGATLLGNSALLESTAQSLDPDARALRLAIDHARRGNAVAARILLVDLCERNPANELAWLWRASLATTADEGLRYLDNVLRLNPQNRTALGWLSKMGRTAAAGRPPAEEPGSFTAAKSSPAVESAAATPSPGPAQGVAATAAVVHQCPVCRGTIDPRDIRCAGCKAILEMKMPADFALNRGFDPAQGAEALEYWRSRAGSCDPLTSDLAQLTIHMNRLDYAEASVSLKQAMQRHVPEPTPREFADGRLFQALTQPVVMVVDDSATIRDVLVRTLTPAGVLPLPVGDAWEVLPVIKKQKPAVLLLDVTMPGMDGYEICRKIRADKETRHLPVLMLTGHDDFMDKLIGKMAGATEYLTKPFNPDALLRSVKKQLEKRG